ncbi:hypothetical protein BC834DRAFT_847332 [Gloeopeniophorella convolvens]|nr:hypothetical protein BC834DRAFT_847332 [Gloeopeniophorella convolvens]
MTDVLHDSHHDAWTAARTKDSANILGAVVQELRVASAPPPHLVGSSLITAESLKDSVLHGSSSAPPPPDGFVLTGTIDIFGLEGLRTDFYSHHAPPPSHINLPRSIVPIHQLAIVRGPVHASKFFPEFADTEFDIVKLEDVQNYSLDHTKPPGWHIGASLTFDQNYGAVHDLLVHILGVENPRLDISCLLGAADWHKPLSISSFVLEGVFADIHSVPCKGLAFTRVGVRIIGYNALAFVNGVMEMRNTYGFGVFGQLHIDVPGRTIPLELDFDVSQVGIIFQLFASLKADWEHAFGVPNLTLKQVGLAVFLTREDPWDSLIFAVDATLDIGTSKILLAGTLAMSGEFALSASVENLSWEQICSIYKHLFGTSLAAPDFPIHIGSITLTISSDSGLSFALHNLQVGSYAAVDGNLIMRSNGASLKAALSNGKLVLDEELGFVIEEAYVEVSFSRDEGAGEVSLMLGGKFKWLEYTVQVGAHVYKINGDDQVHYTVYGAFADTGSHGGFRIADHIPGLEDTCLKDIALSGAAIIIASRDDANLSAISHSPYPVRKGVQICAALTNCGPATKLLKGDTDPTLVMSLAWCEGELDVSILSATPLPLDLGSGIVTDPISLHIVLGTLPKLKIRTGAKIPVSGCESGLHFMLELELDELSATLTGQLAAPGGWNNPFDLSPRLTVGPNLLLSASFLYAGVPSGLGFVGGLQVGKVTGQVALKVSEKPSEQLFSIEVGKIDLLDIVSLTRCVLQCDLLDPPNVIQFDAVKMYACPVGVTLGTLRYPQGFSFICRAVLFGKHVDVDVNIYKTGAKLTGGIDSFTLGPLTVSGFKKPRPSFDIVISGKRQGGTIDGQIEFLGIRTSVFCHFELTPKFIFEFDFELDFAGLFEFKVHAGPIPNKDTSSSSGFLPDDYLLSASFHSKGRKKLAHRIDQLFQEMARKEREDAETAQKKLDEEREAWEAKVGAAQAELDRAHVAWEAKSKDAHNTYAENERQTRADVDALRRDLDEATRKLNEDVSKAQADLWAAQHDREAQISRDEEDLRRTREEWNEKLNSAHRDLDEATRELHSQFGSAQRDLDEAINKVNSLQGEINHVRWQLEDCDNASMWDIPKKAAIPGLAIELAALEVARAVAEGALNIAKGVITGSEFISCEGGVGIAQVAVDAAQSGAHIAIEAAVAALEATKEVTRGFVEAAEVALEGVKRIGEEAVGIARAALSAGEAWIEYEAKRLALEAAKASGSGLLHLAKAGVAVGEGIAEVGRSIAHWVTELFVSLVVITDVELKLELGKAVGGFAFDAMIKGTIKDDDFEVHLHFDPRSAEQLILSLFEKLVEKVKDEILPSIDFD